MQPIDPKENLRLALALSDDAAKQRMKQALAAAARARPDPLAVPVETGWGETMAGAGRAAISGAAEVGRVANKGLATAEMAARAALDAAGVPDAWNVADYGPMRLMMEDAAAQEQAAREAAKRADGRDGVDGFAQTMVEDAAGSLGAMAPLLAAGPGAVAARLPSLASSSAPRASQVVDRATAALPKWAGGGASPAARAAMEVNLSAGLQSGTRSFEGTYAAAREAGLSNPMLRASLDGIVNAAAESGLGAMQGASGALTFLRKLPAGQMLERWMTDALGESATEGMTGVVQHLSSELARGRTPTADDLLDAGLRSAAVGAGLPTITNAPHMASEIRRDMQQRAALRQALEAAATADQGMLEAAAPRDAALAPGRTPEMAAADAAGPGPTTVTPDEADAAATVERDRQDFDAFLGEIGRTPEQFRQAVEQTGDVVEQPADEQGVRVGASAIEGKGILVQGGATAGQPLATAFTADGKRTQVGRYMNHSAEPNADLSLTGDGRIMVVPKQDLPAGAEITVDYRQARQAMQQAQAAKAKPAPKSGKAPAAPAAAKSGEWQAFGPEALGVPRASMPQVRMPDRPAFFDYLKTQGVRTTTEAVDPATLKPTQAEFAPSKVEQAKREVAASKAAGTPVRPVLVSSDGYVIDGHHQWLAAKAAGEQLPVVRVNAPIGQALSLVRSFPKVQQSGGAEGPATTKPKPAAALGVSTATGSPATTATASNPQPATGPQVPPLEAPPVRGDQTGRAAEGAAGASPAAGASRPTLRYAGETDKAAAIARAEASGGLPAPLDIGSTRADGTMKDLARRIVAWATEHLVGKAFTHRATGWKILVTSNGINHAKGKAVFPGDLLLTKHLPWLLENGVVVGSEPDKGGNPDVVRVYKLVAPVVADGQRRYAWITVKEFADKAKRHYHHELVKIEMPGASVSTPGMSDRAAVGTGVPAADGKLAPLSAPSDADDAAGDAQVKPVDPAAASGAVAGEATTIDVPGGQDVPARYEVRELDSLIASNNYSSGQVRSEPRYPAGLQPRNYAAGSQEDLKVNSFAQGQKAGYYVNTSPSAADGPPTVTANGTVLNGNGRTMSLQLAASRGDMGWYRRELDRQAATFGLDPQSYAGMRQPVLVRVVKIEPTSDAAQRFARAGNVAPTQAQSPARTAASLGNLVDQGVIDTLALDDDTTFSEAVSGSAGRDFRQALASSLPPQEVPRYLNEQSGQLTEAGKELVRDLLLTKQFPVELIERMREGRKGMLRSLEQAIPQLMQLDGVAPDARVVEHLTDALDWIARHPDVTLPTHLVDWMDAGGKATQQDLTGRQDGLAPEARMLAEWMLTNAGKGRAVKQGLVGLIRGLENRTSLILGETRSAAEIAAGALGVPAAPGAAFGQAAVQARRQQGDNQAVRQLSSKILAQMPGVKLGDVKVIPDGFNGIELVGKGGIRLKVRLATPDDLARVSEQTGRAVSAQTDNGWYDNATGIIYLIPGAAEQFTFSHEMVHALENIGALTKDEVARLAKIAKARLPKAELDKIEAAYRDEDGRPMDEPTRTREYAAHVIELMNAGVRLKPASFVKRLMDWMRDLGAYLRLTSQSDTSLLREVQSGRAMTRAPSAVVNGGNSDPSIQSSRRRGPDAPGQMSLFGEDVAPPAPAPAQAAEPKASAAEKAVEKLAATVEKVMEQQATLFDLLAKQVAASPPPPAADTSSGGTDGTGSTVDGREAGRPGSERSLDDGDRGAGASGGRIRGGRSGRRGAGAGRTAERDAAAPGDQGAVRGRSEDADGADSAPDVADQGVPRTGPFRFRSVADAMPPRGAITRARANLAAVRALQSVQAEGRQATAAEREAMARFSGWGSLKWAFDPKTATSDDASKRAIYAETLALLPEGSEARERAIVSTLNAHYTHPQVVADVWAMVKRGMGDVAGQPLRALEPSVGLGAFVGLEPDGVRGSLTWSAVEKETATAGMFATVYPEAAIAAMGFEAWTAPDNAFDLAISNVPFGSIPMFDKRYAGELGKPMIHDYFFVKALDKVRPGGLVAFITSTGTMDKDTAEIRKHLYEQADLVHAVRFPADAHDTAGTSVVTDLLILRKRLPDEAKGNDDWLDVGTVPDPLGGSPIPVNRWFLNRPSLVLGRFERSGSLWGVKADGEKNPNVVKQDDYQAKLDAAIAAMPQGVMTPPVGRPEFDLIPAPADLRNHALVGKDGAVWQNQGGTLVKIATGKEKAERVGWMRSLVANLRAVWNAEQAGSDARAERGVLNRTYDSGRAKFGAISDAKNASLFASDPDAPNLMALEEMKGDPDDEDSLSFEKTAIFRQQVVRPPPVVGQARNAAEAVTASMGRSGRVDPALVAEALGVTEEQATEQMRAESAAFEDPAGGWAPAWHYLQGNVKAKLAEARDAARSDQRFQANVQALEAVQPPPVGADKVMPTLGAPFVPVEVMQAFAAEIGVEVYKAGDGRWLVSGGGTTASVAQWGVRGQFRFAGPSMIMDVALNRSMPDMTGKSDDKVLHDPNAVQAVLEKAAELRARFVDWIRLPEQSDRLAATVQVYNDTVNVYRHGDPDTSWITFAGMIDKYKDDTVRRRSVARALTEGRLMLAHEVGLGKSATMFAVAMEARRLGIARKPMIATLNAVVPQLAREAVEAYPGKKILVQPATWGDPGSPTGRDTFMSRLATQDYDVAIVSHETLTSIDNDPDIVRERINERIREIKAAKAAVEASGGKGKDPAKSRYVSSLAKMLENEQQKMAELHSHVLKKDHIGFGDIGTDMLIVDEAHAFKNLPFVTAQEGVKGLGSGSSKRAEDLLMKVRALHRLHGSERGVVLATGTPISNTMTEVFAFQKFLQPGAMKAHGVQHFDDWCRAFGEPKQVQEVQPNGERKIVSRFASWVNMHGLSRMLRDVFDVGLARDNERVRNGLPTSAEKVVKVPLTTMQRQYREWISERMQAIAERKGKTEKGDDIILTVVGDSMRSSIDMRLVAPGATESDGSKVPALADGVANIYRNGPKIDGKAPMQFIFQNVQTQANAWGFNLNHAIIDALVARGIPRSRIAVVDGTMPKKAVAMIKRQAATGRYAVLIGGTEVLGTGTNAQQYALATWHIDVPHRPADIIQRDGRAVRSGNLHKKAGNTVTLHRVVTEGTMDEALWGRVGLKHDFITAMMGAVATPNDATDMREIETEALDPEMVAAMASGDMDLVRVIDLEAEHGRLRRASHAHFSQGEYLRSAARQAASSAATYENSAAELRRMAQAVDGQLPEKATLDDGSDSKALDAALAQWVTDTIQGKTRRERRQLGTFGSLPVEAVDMAERTELSQSGTEMTIRSAVVEYAGGRTTATSGAALLGRMRMRAKELGKLADEDAREAKRLREEAARAEEQAANLGPFKQQAEFEAVNRELGEVRARIAAKPKIPSTLNAEARSGFVAGMQARAALKAAEDQRKDDRKQAKAKAGVQMSRRLPSYLADIPLMQTPEIAALVERGHENLSPDAKALLDAPKAAGDARVYTVNDLPEVHRPKLAALYAGIAEADAALAATAEQVAAQLGGSVKRGPIKKPGRVIAKALNADEGYRDANGVLGDVSQVLDAFRLTIVVPDIDTARQAAAAMEAVYEVPTGSNGKRRFKDRFSNPLPTGYGDILMNVVVNGKVGEVQVHIPEILAVKDLGHELYEVGRVDGVAPATKALMDRESSRLYGAAFGAYADRGGMGAPVVRATQASQSAAVAGSGNVPGTNREVFGFSEPSGATYRRPTPGMSADTASVSASSNVVPAGSVQDQGSSFMAPPPSASTVDGGDGGAMGDSRTDAAMSRRLGRPDLANPGTTGPVRQIVDQVDEARNQAGEPERKPDQEREDEAERRFAMDPDGERRRLIAKYDAGTFTDDVETRIAHHLINRDGLRAVQNQTPDEIIAATKLIAKYRENGSEMARAFRARQDRMATPEERVSLLAQAILTPPAETLAQVRTLYEQGKAQEAEAVMRDHAAKAREVIGKLQAAGIDLNDLSLPDHLVDPVTMAQVVRLVSTLRQTKPGDVMLEYWINAILSGPKTHIVNVAGNTLATAWDTTVQRWAEVAVNAAAGAEGGARAGELVPMYKAMFTALPKAARNFVRSFRAEQDVFEMEISGVPMPGTPGASKVEDRAAIRGIKGRIIRVPTRILTATDSFNKTLIGHAQAAAEAYRAGVDRKLTGKALDQFMAGELADLSSMSWHRGLGYAQELTFQAEDKTGLLKKIQNARSWETVGGLKPLAFIVPFTRTPWNIFAMGMRKSPLGAFALAYRVGKEGYRRTWDKAGAMDPYTGRDAVRHSAEQMLAWAIMLALWGMVDDEDERGRPMITGTGEPISGNQGKRQLEQRAAPPLSIRFGDTWVSYGRLEPAAVAIGMTVDLLEEVKAGTATAVSVGKVASLIARQTEEKTFLSGISDLINVAEDPERYAAQWSGRFAASWVPNLIRQPLREGQQYVPESKPLPSDGDDGAVALWLKGVRQQAFPIESFTQRPKVDVWGRPIERNPLQTSWVGRMLEGTLSPAARRVDKATDLDLIVKAWNDANPEGEWWPVTPRPYFVVNKRRVDLTEEQYHAFLLERGRMAVEQLGHLRWDPARPVEEWQLKAIQGALTRATRMAKATVLDRPDMQLDGEQASR